MIITLTRSGGFTGIPQKKTIDTRTLDLKKAKEIEDLVSKSQALVAGKGQPQGIASTKSEPDRFAYTITIQNDTVFRSLDVHEESLDPDMQELIECLQSL